MLKMLITHGEHSASLGIRSTRSQIRSAHGKKKKKKVGGGKSRITLRWAGLKV